MLLLGLKQFNSLNFFMVRKHQGYLVKYTIMYVLFWSVYKAGYCIDKVCLVMFYQCVTTMPFEG